MGSNKYTITKIKCWPVFKQDPILVPAILPNTHGDGYIYIFIYIFKEIKILPDYRVWPKLSHSYTPCVFRGEIYFLLFEKNI